jgi:hypothetical protein
VRISQLSWYQTVLHSVWLRQGEPCDVPVYGFAMHARFEA